MFSNIFTGTIPPIWSALASLRDLYLNNNMLTGTVPAISSGDLASLTEFLLQNNDITGSMPASVCDLRGDGLEDLQADCEGSPPQIECDCCTQCFP